MPVIRHIKIALCRPTLEDPARSVKLALMTGALEATIFIDKDFAAEVGAVREGQEVIRLP